MPSQTVVFGEGLSARGAATVVQRPQTDFLFEGRAHRRVDRDDAPVLFRRERDRLKTVLAFHNFDVLHHPVVGGLVNRRLLPAQIRGQNVGGVGGDGARSFDAVRI